MPRASVRASSSTAALPVSLIRRTRQLAQRTGPVAQLLPITVCAAMLAFLVFASFNVVIESPQVSILFWVLLGIGAGALHDRLPIESSTLRPEEALAEPQVSPSP